MKTKLILLAALITLSACTSLKSLTGQLDNTVLPGEREAVISPEFYTKKDPALVGGGSDAVLSEAPAALDQQTGAAVGGKKTKSKKCDSTVEICDEFGNPVGTVPEADIF